MIRRIVTATVLAVSLLFTPAAPASAVESGWDSLTEDSKGRTCIRHPDRCASTPDGKLVPIGATPAAAAGRKGSTPVIDEQGHAHAGVQTLTGAFRYAGFSQAYNAPGLKANVDVPTVGTPDTSDHSLVELDIEREAGAGPIDRVEIGFNIDATLYGNTSPHLFVYSGEAGVGQGYNGGNGYTDIVDTCGAGGTNVVAGQTETAGTAVSLETEYGGTPTGWYLYRNGCAFGYYPASAWTGTTFTSATTTLVQAFGEVWDADGGSTPCTDMGNGTLASNAPAGAAVGSVLLGTGVPSSAVNMVGYTINTISASYYAQVNVAGSKRTERYGGPGAC